MNTLIIILLNIVFVVPLLYWAMVYGVTESVSDIFRVMQKRHGRGSFRPWSFWLWLAMVGALFFAYFLNGVAFLTMFGLVLLGAAAEYWKSKHVEIPHITGALVGILGGYATLIVHAIKADHWLTGVWCLIAGVFGALLMDKYLKKNTTYWIEVIQFIMIIVGITLIDFIYV